MDGLAWELLLVVREEFLEVDLILGAQLLSNQKVLDEGVFLAALFVEVFQLLHRRFVGLAFQIQIALEVHYLDFNDCLGTITFGDRTDPVDSVLSLQVIQLRFRLGHEALKSFDFQVTLAETLSESFDLFISTFHCFVQTADISEGRSTTAEIVPVSVLKFVLETQNNLIVVVSLLFELVLQCSNYLALITCPICPSPSIAFIVQFSHFLSDSNIGTGNLLIFLVDSSFFVFDNVVQSLQIAKMIGNLLVQCFERALQLGDFLLKMLDNGLLLPKQRRLLLAAI